jgi:hypothetical protein
MPDDRNKQQGQQGGMDEGQKGGAHQAPGRNPQDDQSTGGAGDREDREGQGGFGGSNKEGGQNEQIRR